MVSLAPQSRATSGIGAGTEAPHRPGRKLPARAGPIARALDTHRIPDRSACRAHSGGIRPGWPGARQNAGTSSRDRQNRALVMNARVAPVAATTPPGWLARGGAQRCSLYCPEQLEPGAEPTASGCRRMLSAAGKTAPCRFRSWHRNRSANPASRHLSPPPELILRLWPLPTGAPR
jgi:hypothetical protein